MHIEYMDNTQLARDGLREMISKHKENVERKKNKAQELQAALGETLMILESMESTLKMMEEDLAELEATKEEE